MSLPAAPQPAQGRRPLRAAPARSGAHATRLPQPSAGRDRGLVSAPGPWIWAIRYRSPRSRAIRSRSRSMSARRAAAGGDRRRHPSSRWPWTAAPGRRRPGRGRRSHRRHPPRSPGFGRLLALGRAQALQASTPLPPLPDAALNALPKLPLLAAGAPRSFDLERGQRTTWLMRADKPGLYAVARPASLPPPARCAPARCPSCAATRRTASAATSWCSSTCGKGTTR